MEWWHTCSRNVCTLTCLIRWMLSWMPCNCRRLSSEYDKKMGKKKNNIVKTLFKWWLGEGRKGENVIRVLIWIGLNSIGHLSEKILNFRAGILKMLIFFGPHKTDECHQRHATMTSIGYRKYNTHTTKKKKTKKMLITQQNKVKKEEENDRFLPPLCVTKSARRP